jgi:hypothetical protein
MKKAKPLSRTTQARIVADHQRDREQDRVTALQALREVEGDCYALSADESTCLFCGEREGQPHDPDCTMVMVLAAIKLLESK